MASARQNPDLLRAGHAMVTNDLPTAESILRPYLKQHPTDVAAIRMMAELAARVGRLPDAENVLTKLLPAVFDSVINTPTNQSGEYR